MQRYTIAQFNTDFPTEDACLEFIRSKRYPERIECPKCGKANKFHRVTGRKVYECDYCGYQLSPTAGTILHKSSTSLRSWFYAIFLMAQTRTGISAKQLERELGVTYKTAWRMFTQIRKLMGEHGLSFFGDIEADETYIGGQDKNRHANKKFGSRGRGKTGKTIVIGMVERGGKAVTKVAPDASAKTLVPFIQEHAPEPSNTTMYTDEHTGYLHLKSLGYDHRTVDHAAKQYVSSGAHTNGMENLWSNIKRGINGVHHSVSPEYLSLYLDSYVFRFNHRDDSAPMFQTLLGRVPATSTGWVL
jgi:transposase-like protein